MVLALRHIVEVFLTVYAFEGQNHFYVFGWARILLGRLSVPLQL